jgi:4-hydroxybenzoyl-CoA thioesterase
MGVHVHRIEVRFGDCDPAGIVYFPRFFAMFHDAMETWFSAGLGLRTRRSSAGASSGSRRSTPRRTSSRPCALGDAIAVELRVTALGRSSIVLGYTVRGAAATCG